MADLVICQPEPMAATTITNVEASCPTGVLTRGMGRGAKGKCRLGALQPVSSGLLSDTAAYFEALTIYREDPEPMILATASASFRAIIRCALVNEIGRTLGI